MGQVSTDPSASSVPTNSFFDMFLTASDPDTTSSLPTVSNVSETEVSADENNEVDVSSASDNLTNERELEALLALPTTPVMLTPTENQIDTSITAQPSSVTTSLNQTLNDAVKSSVETASLKEQVLQQTNTTPSSTQNAALAQTLQEETAAQVVAEIPDLEENVAVSKSIADDLKNSGLKIDLAKNDEVTDEMVAESLASNKDISIKVPLASPRNTLSVRQDATPSASILPSSLKLDLSAAESLSDSTVSLSSPISNNAAIPNLTVTSPEQNQYLSAFQHLSHFINNETSRLNLNELTLTDPKSALLASPEQKMAQNMNYDLSVQLMPALGELKEGYAARIQMYPPELGQIVAKLKMNQNNAELVIMTENNHVKQIVESNLPALKQHFQNANINLTDVSVQAGPSNSEQQKEDSSAAKKEASENQQVDNNSVKTATKTTKKSTHTIDTYA